MPPTAPDPWLDRVRDALSRYDESLRRIVASKLIKSRTVIPVEDLVEKCIATLFNPPVVDRRIKDLSVPARQMLALIALSRRPTWKVGHLVTLLSALGHHEGYAPVVELLDAGLLYPVLPPGVSEVHQFEGWLTQSGGLHAVVFTHPTVAGRTRSEGFDLPELPGEKLHGAARTADGLDWLLRLAVVWQQVDETPVRLTQASLLFKRDLGRLQTDGLLNAAPPDQLGEVAEPGVLSLFWANAVGLVSESEGELRAQPFPASWGSNLDLTLAEVWSALTAVEVWDPLTGYTPADAGTAPAPTAGFLALLLLARTDGSLWIDPQAVADWLWSHHPSWPSTLSKDESRVRGLTWVRAFLLGVAYPLRLVEAIDLEGWKVRLSPLGRHLVAGAPAPSPAPAFPQALLVQPNAEVLAYRQGLTPGLIAKLSRFAAWTGLGPACTLQLTPTRTYQGLESGLPLASVLQTLNQHGMRPVPTAVDDLLRRWSDKRERITVYPSATLVEFQSPADLEAAIARGVVSVRVTDRIALAGDGSDPDYKHLRLIGNRDYESRPQRCLDVADDGVTLIVDTAQSDLLLEAEISRLAEPVTGDPPGLRRYRLTPSTLRRAVETGFSLSDLDDWFRARAGQPLSPAGRCFVLGPQLPPPTTHQYLVIQVETADLADGFMQWHATAPLIDRRLGPTAFVVDRANLTRFKEVLGELGIGLESQTVV
jgi:hypothetical protein